ncbi:amino acid permease-domain-containing protein [Russula compacta]|nr:amino acid permease-domain-containing protein [Russula compacta]
MTDSTATTTDGRSRSTADDESSSSLAAGEKRLTLFDGIALIVGMQIGSGIFSSPGVIVAHIQSVRASLVIWMVAALLAWTGAGSFAELGASLPRNGVSLISPGTKALNSLVFAEYLNRVLWNATRGDDAPSEVIPRLGDRHYRGRGCRLCLSSRSWRSQPWTPRIERSDERKGPRDTFYHRARFLPCISCSWPRARDSKSTLAGDPLPTAASYARALYAGLWAFSGFNQANFVAGEMQHPERDIPRAINISMGLIAVLFVLVNAAYFSVLDKAEIARTNTIALDFGWALFGRAGGVLYALVVALSCLGVLTGSLFTSSRVVYAAARTGQLPRAFGVLDANRGTPIRAVALQAGLTIVLIFLGGGFRSLVRIAVVALWGFYCLTVRPSFQKKKRSPHRPLCAFGLVLNLVRKVLAVVILRVREPDLRRPYKTWITTPLIFCAVTIFLICVPALAEPGETLVVVCYVAAGVPAYYITRKGNVVPEETQRLIDDD